MNASDIYVLVLSYYELWQMNFVRGNYV